MNRGQASVGVLLLLGALLSSGCSHSRFKVSQAPRPSLPSALAADFEYERCVDRPAKISVLEKRGDYQVKRVALEVAPTAPGTTNRYIELDYYELTSTNKTPVIMVLPMLGGGYGLERHFANYFASRGYAAMIVRRDKRASKATAEDLNGLFRDMVLDHRRVIDWIETQSKLDADRIGIFGVSMGGIKGALLLPVESRIRAAALGLAGGDLPYIMTHSTEPGVAKRREIELSERNITLEEAEQRLRDLLKFDPLTYAPYVDPRKVLLVLARYDTVVPIEKGLELKKVMGNPETIMIPANHYSAVLSIPYIKSQSFDFFEKRFAAAAPNTAKKGGGFTHAQSGAH